MLSVGIAAAMHRTKHPGTQKWLCDHIGADETGQVLLLLVFPGILLLLMLTIVPLIIRSVRVLRGGYAPPLDAMVSRAWS